jgi:hypothetical protein
MKLPKAQVRLYLRSESLVICTLSIRVMARIVWELLGLRLIRLTSGTSWSGVEEAVRMIVVLVLIVPLPRLWFVVSIDHLTRLAPEPTHVMPTR